MCILFLTHSVTIATYIVKSIIYCISTILIDKSNN